MQRYFALAVLCTWLVVNLAWTHQASDSSGHVTRAYDAFHSDNLDQWQMPNPVARIADGHLILKQKARFKRVPLLSSQTFDLDLASQQYPIDLTVKLVAITGNRSNTREYNNIELGWADGDGKLVFAWRWELTQIDKSQAYRLFNSQRWTNFIYTKPSQSVFKDGDVIGLRITDAAVQMLRNGKVVRQTGRPSDLENTGKCRIYLSWVGPVDGAQLQLDDVRVDGLR